MNFKIVLLASALLVSSSAFSQIKNPLIRSCVISEGTFEVTSPGTPKDFPYCHLGEGTLDAFSVHGSVSQEKPTDALFAFAQSSSGRNSDCQAWGATTTLVTFSKYSANFCIFADGSKIDLESLQLGNQSPERAKMRRLIQR